jgi:hypothetical protein
MVKSILPLILGKCLLTITVNCKFYRNRKNRCRFFDISAKNLLASGVAFGNKAGKLLILTDECKMWLLFVL